MIVFDLQCHDGGHRFEGWFGSSDDFASQQQRGLVTCPTCGSPAVGKAVMAPNLGRKGNQMPVHVPSGNTAPGAVSMPQPHSNQPLPPEAVAMFKAIATMQAEALKSSTWVGDNFAEDARAMHYGEKDAAPIHGQATPDEARELFEEGVDVAPLLFPVAPPGEAN